MDADRFDDVTRSLIGGSSRRTAIGLALGGLLVSLHLADVEARHRHKHKKRRQQNQPPPCPTCGVCQSCQQGSCRSVADGTACGDCQTCQGGQCTSTCQGGKTCQAGTCTCPSGSKDCAGTCIGNDQCCGACPQGQTCCTNVGECKDVRNDSAFCGQCANAQCPGTDFCANGACSRTCNTTGAVCLAPDCLCGDRVDPAHTGQKVCAEIVPFTCDSVTICSTDAECSPFTEGFRQVCASGLCTGKNVCADPCQ